MADKTGIEWTDATWNPVTGCTKVSQGCKHCYAERNWARLVHMPAFAGRAFTDVACHLDRIDQPLHWKKPRRIFVNSMSDLFHEDVPVLFVADIFAVMAAAKHHTFQVLTKRPQYLLEILGAERVLDFRMAVEEALALYTDEPLVWPLPNVWLGVSVEDQATADERIPLLLQTPAAVRWISAEPLLGPVNLQRIEHHYSIHADVLGGLDSRAPCDSGLLDWVVVGGESGPKARPIHPDWARSLRDQCQAAGVPFLFKQWGEWQIASEENGHCGSVMPETGERYTWIDIDGKTYNPNPPWELDSCCWAMAKVGKKRAGRLLDGALHDGYPEVKP